MPNLHPQAPRAGSAVPDRGLSGAEVMDTKPGVTWVRMRAPNTSAFRPKPREPEPAVYQATSPDPDFEIALHDLWVYLAEDGSWYMDTNDVLPDDPQYTATRLDATTADEAKALAWTIYRLTGGTHV